MCIHKMEICILVLGKQISNRRSRKEQKIDKHQKLKRTQIRKTRVGGYLDSTEETEEITREGRIRMPVDRPTKPGI